MDIEVGEFQLRGLGFLNVILGKNGCGKSHLLKQVEQPLQHSEEYGHVRYISPERGGFLKYEAGIEQNIARSPNWMLDDRRRNQSANFKQQSAVLFRQLELLSLRAIEEEHFQPDYVCRSFDVVVEQLNGLLDRIRVERLKLDATRVFRIVDRDTGEEADAETISSGESELISLGIEFLAFVQHAEDGKENLLLVDEPDVHLHPDLQYRLAQFLVAILKDKPVRLILATHSTALLAGIADAGDVRVAFMRRKDHELNFKSVTEVDRRVLPIFGAHPLSNVFNRAPVLLIEGEDDERIWQQAIRSGQGRVRSYPCAVDGISRFVEFETEVNNIIESVYEDARAFSLRDRDLHPETIENVGHVVRARLSCRAAENLMLSDDVLALIGTDWPSMEVSIRDWVTVNDEHQYHPEMQGFVYGGLDRKGHDLKDVRNILAGLITNKPWEVLVGQAIAKLARANVADAPEDSLADYLGPAVCRDILGLPI